MLKTSDMQVIIFLKERMLSRHKENNVKKTASETILNKTNYSNKYFSKTSYSNNLNEENFQMIVDKQLVYELDDYKTNYIYNTKNSVDSNLKFNLQLQDDILEFVTENFYGKDEQYKFMRLINETFSQAINVFTKKFNIDKDDIKLIFYNDVVLRKMAEKFIYTLPNKSAIHLSDYFDIYFNSDSLDWYIILNPTLDNYDEIHNKLKFYIALIMKQLNTYIILNKNSIFKYFKYNESYKDYIKLELSFIIEQALNNLKEYNRTKQIYEVTKVQGIKGVHLYKYGEQVVLLNNNANKTLFQLNIVEESNHIKYHQCMNFEVLVKNGVYSNSKEYREKNMPIKILYLLQILRLQTKQMNSLKI